MAKTKRKVIEDTNYKDPDNINSSTRIMLTKGLSKRSKIKYTNSGKSKLKET